MENKIRLSLAEGTIRSADGQVVALSARELLILGFLVLRKGLASVDALADAVWPDVDGDRARANLKVYAFRIRARAGRPDVVVCEKGRWRLGTCVAVDLWEWERLADTGQPGLLLPSLREVLVAAHASLTVGPPPALVESECGAVFSVAFETVLAGVAECLIADAFSRHDLVRAASLARAMIALDPYEARWRHALSRVHAERHDPLGARRVMKEYDLLVQHELRENAFGPMPGRPTYSA